MQNARLDESQPGIKIARINISNLRYADNTTLIAESEEELKSLLIRVKEESEKAGWKLNIKTTKIMVSILISFLANRTEKNIEGMTNFIFLGSRITVDAVMKLKDACSLKGKLWQNYIAYLKAGITWPTKGHIIRSIAFPVVMYGYESWTTREAESWGTNAFELWGWEPDSGKDWKQKVKGTAKDEMVK